MIVSLFLCSLFLIFNLTPTGDVYGVSDAVRQHTISRNVCTGQPTTCSPQRDRMWTHVWTSSRRARPRDMGAHTENGPKGLRQDAAGACQRHGHGPWLRGFLPRNRHRCDRFAPQVLSLRPPRAGRHPRAAEEVKFRGRECVNRRGPLRSPPTTRPRKHFGPLHPTHVYLKAANRTSSVTCPTPRCPCR